MKYLTLAIAITLLPLSGCVTQPERITQTASGNPEVIITTGDVARVKSALINRAIDNGFAVEQDTPYSLVIAKPASGGDAFAAAMFVGNAYSVNSNVITFTIVKVDTGIRVVAACSLRAQMVGGQTRSQPMNSNVVFNSLQQRLTFIKSQIEAEGQSTPLRQP